MYIQAVRITFLCMLVSLVLGAGIATVDAGQATIITAFNRDKVVVFESTQSGAGHSFKRASEVTFPLQILETAKSGTFLKTTLGWIKKTHVTTDKKVAGMPRDCDSVTGRPKTKSDTSRGMGNKLCK
jgi:putative flippase GtrA